MPLSVEGSNAMKQLNVVAARIKPERLANYLNRIVELEPEEKIELQAAINAALDANLTDSAIAAGLAGIEGVKPT